MAYKRPASWICHRNMMSRCYDEKCKSYERYGARGILVAKEWHDREIFLEFYNKFYKEGYALDKDLIRKNSKIYSEDTCCFLPRELNHMLITSQKSSTTPPGVSWRAARSKYVASCRNGSGQVYLGCYNDPMEAFLVYKQYKEDLIKTVAKEYYENSMISGMIYNHLLAFKVEIGENL